MTLSVLSRSSQAGVASGIEVEVALLELEGKGMSATGTKVVF